MIEGEEDGLWPLERLSTARAAEVDGEALEAGAEHVHRDFTAALAQRGLDRLRETRPAGRIEHDAIEHDFHRAHAVERRGLEIDDGAIDAKAREPASHETRTKLGRGQSPGQDEAEADQRPAAGVPREQRLGDRCARMVRGFAAAIGAMHAPDLGVEEPQIVVDLGRRPDGGAGGTHGVLLLEGDGGPHIDDAVHVRTVDAVEEHARVRAQRLDVAPLAFREERVERERRFS